MTQIDDDSNPGVVLNVRLPRGTDPALASSLKRGMEELLTVVLAMPEWEVGMLQRADQIALAFTGLVAPAAPLIEERIRRQKTMYEVFAHGDWFTAEQINALQATPPANKAQPARDWQRQGRIFGVSFNGKEYFAGYQFDAMCQPLPIIQDVLEALGPVDDRWKIAAWFDFPNGWIAGRGDHQREPVVPRQALDRRDEVIDAACHMQEGYAA